MSNSGRARLWISVSGNPSRTSGSARLFTDERVVLDHGAVQPVTVPRGIGNLKSGSRVGLEILSELDRVGCDRDGMVGGAGDGQVGSARKPFR